jgi:RNA polymerase sigma-70 factor
VSGAREREAVLSLVRAKVHLRFALDAGAFTDRVLAAAADGSGTAPPASAARLSLDDLYLASACAAGEEAAWAELAERHFGFIRTFARRILADDRALDVADQVIADMWQRGKIARFDGRSSLRTWLGVVVTRAALNALKAARVTLPIESVASEPGRPQLVSQPRPDVEERSRLLSALIPRALAELADGDKLVLLLHYEQGLTLEQIGVVCGGSKATVSRRLARIRAEVGRAVDQLARGELGTSAAELWEGAEVSLLDLDLAAALVGPQPAQSAGRCTVQEA